MKTRDFHGTQIIQEVECVGANLRTDSKLISLQLFKLPDSTVLASLNVFARNCMTYGEYASCAINPDDSHKSRLRVLVHDLREGESREYGCTANTVTPQGNSVYKNWKILVTRNRKYVCYCIRSARFWLQGTVGTFIIVYVVQDPGYSMFVIVYVVQDPGYKEQ